MLSFIQESKRKKMNPPTALESNERLLAPERQIPPDRQLPPAHAARPEEHAPNPKKRRSYWWIWVLLLGGLGYGTYRYLQQTQDKKQAAERKQAERMMNRPVPVVTAPAHVGNVPVYLRGLGSVTAFNTVTVKSRVDGPLTQVFYREGQFIQKGDPLAEIDPRPFQVQLEQAQGQLSRDLAQLNDAKVNLARYQALWDEKVIAKQQLDTQAAMVGQFEGTIDSDQAAIDNAKLQLSFTKIAAPLSGRIGLRLVDVGNIVHASDATGIAVIAQMQPITVLFTIPADNLPAVLRKLRAGVKLPVEAFDRDDKNRIASGTLLTVDNTIDATTGTSRLKAVFNNNDDSLFPNQFVNARLLIDQLSSVVLIQSVAVQHGPNGNFVYVVAGDGKAAVRNVTLGITEANNTVIQSGLRAGERVVTDGQDKLQEGVKVEDRSVNRGQSGKRGAGAINGAKPNMTPPSQTPGQGTRP